MHSFFLLKSNNNHNNELKKCLTENPNVNNLAKLNGDWNFLIEVFFRNIKDFEPLLKPLKMILKELRFRFIMFWKRGNAKDF